MMSRAVKVCTLTSHPLPHEGEEVKFGDLRSSFRTGEDTSAIGGPTRWMRYRCVCQRKLWV